jgi:alkylation response protein AidB-like acyl-CoA dehydrogenase
MDFSFTSDQQDLRELAAKILSDATTLERTKQVVAESDGFDRDLWAALADAGIIGISLPGSVGGAGLGFLETCIVLEEVGRTAAPIPALAVMGLAAPALAEFGATDALDGVAAGTRIVTAALTEAVGDVYSPSTSVNGGKLTGEKVCVPAGLDAQAIVVSAIDGIYLVDPSSAGVTVEREATMLGAPTARLVLSDAEATKLAGPEGLTWLLERAQTAMTVMMSGAAQAALDLTATYVKEREQFGRAIATFQAVSQRTADTYINKEAIKLTAWQAAWRLDAGVPASAQVDAAKYWAAQGGQDVLLAAHHLHGGVGVDRDYPLYRYFLLAKQLELSLGSATPSLVRLGALLADTPVR